MHITSLSGWKGYAWISAFSLVLGFNLSLPAAENIIVFIGDGMGFEHVKAAGFYNGAPLSFEAFPHQGQVTTYSANEAITDSAAAATAIATGFKVNNDVVSVALPGDGRELETMLELFKKRGKATGLITTTYLTHATPACFGAHDAHRNNGAAIGNDLMTQTRPNILFGGGGNGLDPATALSQGYAVATSAATFGSLDPALSNLCALFGTGYMPYEEDYLAGTYPYPHLTEMVVKALDSLEEAPNGFFLMVEGGRIDNAGHGGLMPEAVHETLEFGRAVQAALDWMSSRTDTLILVTADHETGGLEVLDATGTPGVYPSARWGSTGHTAAPVPVYAMGPGAERVSGVLDNTDFLRLVTMEGAAEPFLYGVSVQDLTDTSASIVWHTEEPSDSLVEIRPVNGVWTQILDPALTSMHRVEVTGLVAGLTYEYRVTSAGTGSTTSATYSFRPIYDPAAQVKLIAQGAVWKYHDQGVDLGSAWRERSYVEDGLWQEGPAELGYGDGGEKTLVQYGPSATAKYPACYFRKTFSIADPAAYGELSLRLLRDDGAVVYLNGVEVHRVNMPAGSIQYTNYSSSAVDIDWDAAITVTNLLVAGENVLAVEIHQSSGSSTDLSFDLSLHATANHVQIIKGPWLQKVKDSSIVVMWETDRPAGSRVDYGVGSADEVQITDATPATIHEVTLTGLAPNTLYHYTVASDYAVSGEASFQTALGTPEESFRWVVYGDTQVPATHQAVIDSILVNNPLPRFVLHVGDLVEQGRMHNDWGTFFSPAGPMLRQIPLFPTLGDHEYLGTEQMWYFDFFNLPENGTASGTEEWYAFTYGSVRFIALNSAASFGPGSAQHNWLLSELQSDAFQNAGWKIVFLHQGPYANQTPDLVAADLVPLFHQYGVHLVFNGHDHNYRHIYRQDPATGRRVDYITTGGGGAALTTPVGIPDDPTLGLVKAGAVHHYCVLDVSPGSLAFKAVDTSGGIIDAITFYDITDTSPPVITGVAATNVSDTTATITWATDESANAVVQYAPGATWFEAGDPLFMTAHNIVLSGLTPSTLYSYQVISTDPAGNSAQSPVLSFTTRHQNFAPLALDGSMSLDEDAHLSGFQLLATDENGDTLNFHIVSGPAHGLLGGTPPILDYWPEPNYSGTDSFTFTADDGFLVSAPATITINVNAVPDAPTAPDDLTATAEDRTITLNWVPGSDVEGDALTYTIYRNESLVAQNVTGTSFVDSDLANGTTYSYRVRTADSTGLVSPASNEASAIPSKPDFNAYVVQNPMVEIGSLISGNFSDLLAEDGAGQILQEAKVGLFGQLKAQYVLRTVAKPSEVAGLTLVLNATTLTAIDDPGWYLFAWNGTTWDRVGDLTVGTSTLEIALDPARHLATDGTVLISLQDGANRKRENLDRLSIDQLYARVLTGGKPTAKEDAYTTSEDVVLMIPVPGLLGNDSDPENGQLSAMLVSGPANGLLSLNADGSFVYTPRADFNGADTFSYKAGNGLVDSLPVTVTITVAPVNDAPLAVADAYNMTQGTTLSITAAGVLANDDDADGNALTVSLSAAPSNGNLALAADGSFTYTPSAGFTGVETFSYVAGDGSENSQPATVTITVTAASSTPKIHVAGMAMGIDSGRKNIKGTVMVMVLDQEGIAVAGATVSGGWQLGENAIGSASGVTDASGTVVLASVPVKDTSGSFTFTVNNIALAGADYDPQANVLTSATISF